MLLPDKVKQIIRDVPDFPKPGILFKDITPVLANPELVQAILVELVRDFSPLDITAVVGIESRGFIFGSLLAHALNLPFVPVRKAGKLPYKTVSQSYELEYGQATLEIHNDALKPGDKVLIHDDLLATGGTAIAAGRLAERLGAKVQLFSFLINLSFLKGEEALKNEFSVSTHSLINY